MAYDWRQDLARLEAKYNIPPGLLGALVRAESGGRQQVSSPAGAIGLTQLMPSTARGLGVNPHDPRQNLEGGAKYLSQQLRRFKNVQKALAAYNAGPGAVEKYGGIPPYKETQQYVKRLTGYWKESSRYGTTPGRPGRVVPGGSQRVRIPVPTALDAPTRQIQPGLESSDEARLRDAYRKDPTMAQFIMNNRVKQQNLYDSKFNEEQTAYEVNQQAIAQARATNQSRIQRPNRIIPGTLGSQGPSGTWSPTAKFVRVNGKWVRNYDGREQRYQFLQRVGRGFGLRNDPGNYQTTGGRHAAGSNHYAGRAIDFGDARNSRDQLFQFANWARQNASNIRELYYNPLGWGIRDGKVIQGLTQAGHDDHLHAAW